MKQARSIKETVHLTGLFIKAFRVVLLSSRPAILSKQIKRNPGLLIERTAFDGKDGPIPVALYTRQKKKRRPVFIFLSCNEAFAWKKRQIKRLARALAIAGYHAILFENNISDSLRIADNQTDVIGDLIDAVAGNSLFDGERIILVAADFNTRLVFKAMQTNRVPEKIRAFVFLSPVTDFNALVRFACTGRVKFGKHWVARPSSSGLRLLHFYNMLGQYFDNEPNILPDILKLLLTGQRTEAFDSLKNLDRETRDLVLALFRGDVPPETTDILMRLDKKFLANMFLPTLPDKDIGKPVFIFQSIYDKDVDCGQSQILFKNLFSSKGVHLHYSDYYSSESYRHILLNPIRWLKGAFRLALALYRVFANVYSTKNLPYNPTGEPLRFRN